MSRFYHFWKVWLWINNLQRNTRDEEYSVEMSTRNIIKSNKDIVEKLIADGVDINYSNFTYIIDQYDRVVRDMLCDGYSVKTNNVIFSPRLSGEWNNEYAEFTPTIHQRIIDCTLSPEINSILSSIGIQVQGFKDPSCYISCIIDNKSGEKDLISRNCEITIEGKGIKAISKDGTTVNCILLLDENNLIFDIGQEISLNEEDEIKLQIPESLENGKYSLIIQTYYSSLTMKKPVYARCIEYEKKIIVT